MCQCSHFVTEWEGNDFREQLSGSKCGAIFKPDTQAAGWVS